MSIFVTFPSALHAYIPHAAYYACYQIRNESGAEEMKLPLISLSVVAYSLLATTAICLAELVAVF